MCNGEIKQNIFTCLITGQKELFQWEKEKPALKEIYQMSPIFVENKNEGNKQDKKDFAVICFVHQLK